MVLKKKKTESQGCYTTVFIDRITIEIKVKVSIPVRKQLYCAVSIPCSGMCPQWSVLTTTLVK